MKIYYGLEEVEDVVDQIIKNVKTKTILFYGNMGVGKTTIIKTLVKRLGSNDVVNSPTFSIVNEYNIRKDKIYHFDLYRIEDLEEAYNFGIEDYIDSDHWILIEWPELIEPILNNNYDKINIEIDSNIKLRILKINN
ncbi:MAG: tRNA (adenosine(37)-N6)-threonylcarbamoyltransferase complex ATPase subunit type 1 TsaE [Flaviramulus sp.]|nr:tRNA (adenosine(37)-N6)-threonylcarbamoyltransferase complex ATPase subunit type 1 TsaE [Flaviramulus sp.]